MSQCYETATLLWRGFTHRWEYNHRVNRLGDYIDAIELDRRRNEARGTLVHSAASGSGPDTIHYQSMYSQLSLSGVGVISGERAFSITGQSGFWAGNPNWEKKIIFDLPPELRGKARYEAVLNGFDIWTDDEFKANSLHGLEIEIANIFFNTVSNKVEVDIMIRGRFNCSTPECKRPLDPTGPVRTFKYNGIVKVLLFAGDEGFHSAEKRFDDTYDWVNYPMGGGSRNLIGGALEINRTAERKSIQGRAGMLHHAFGFKAIKFNLNAEHHMLQWDSYILPQHTSRTGLTYFDLGLMFKTWRVWMSNAHLPESLGAFDPGGSAELSATVCLLQFSNAKVEHLFHNGSFDWETSQGNQSKASSPAACLLHSIDFPVDYCMGSPLANPNPFFQPKFP